MINRRHLASALALGAMSLQGLQAQPSGPPRVYGVMSLVADYLTVTGFESTTGTLVRANPTERIDLQTDELERVVIRVATRAVTDSRTGKAVPLLSDDGRLYGGQSKLVNGDEVNLPGFLSDTLRAQQATHLLLVTKHNGVANMRARDVDLGTGRVEGLGFYLDRVTPLRLTSGGENSLGYLAPHVYLRLSLIDLQRNRVMSFRLVTATRVLIPAGTNAGANPWDLMDSAAKMKVLSELIEEGTTPAWREILAS
jgi:hypothetical protein